MTWLHTCPHCQNGFRDAAERDAHVRRFQGESWNAGKALLAGVFGLPMDDEAAALYRQHTGRTTLPTTPAREAFVCAGRRAGESYLAALIAVYLAAFRDYRHVLAPGERATVMVLAADRRQARIAFRYVRGFIENVPMLRAMVVGEGKEGLELSNGASIEIHTSSFRSVRGYSCAAVICDEIAFWSTDDAGANPDTEILNALRPSMATIPGAMLIAISSPYARRGALWEAYRRHYGKDGDPVLVWQADTASMNRAVDPQVIADAYAADESSAAAEYGAEFRRDIETFISREAVDACIVPDRHELPPTSGISYVAFVDPSGGSVDSMTLAIAHREEPRHGGSGEQTARIVLDCVRERKPPFSPEEVTVEFAEVVKHYSCSSVTGDRYGGEFCREPFRRRGVEYRLAQKVRSDLYRDLLPLLNSSQVELLDHATLTAQLCALERRTARSGRDTIDHAPNQHEDLANAAAGAIGMAAAPQHSMSVSRLMI